MKSQTKLFRAGLRRMRSLALILPLLALLAGCAGPAPVSEVPTATLAPVTATTAASATLAPTASQTPAPTDTPAPSATFTVTPSITLTPTVTQTPTITPSPTYDFPKVKATMQAFCRYGPGKAYLFSFGLYPGDTGVVHGKNYNGSWLWVKPDNLDRHCWAAASVFEISGDITPIIVWRSELPHSVLYLSPSNVTAVRNGSSVIVSWSKVDMTEDDDRGYLIEANVCQNGAYFPVAYQTNSTSIEIPDEPGCGAPSSGLLYTVEKHGYTDPVTIPWP